MCECCWMVGGVNIAAPPPPHGCSTTLTTTLHNRAPVVTHLAAPPPRHTPHTCRPQQQTPPAHPGLHHQPTNQPTAVASNLRVNSVQHLSLSPSPIHEGDGPKPFTPSHGPNHQRKEMTIGPTKAQHNIGTHARYSLPSGTLIRYLGLGIRH